MTQVKRIFCLAVLAMLAPLVGKAAEQPIAIAKVNRSEPVDFKKDIVPILQRSCLACHSASDANGELNLETPQAMIKGGDSGPAIVPGKSGESLLLKVAAHQDEPLMPPEDNDVSAKNLNSQELGLLKLWIDQGAKGTGTDGILSPASWKPLPPGKHPIFAVAVSPDGQFAACGRANQIFIYHVATGQVVTRLNDPSLQEASADKKPGAAHLDVVQSLSFNSQGDMLASGGFRTAKLWRYPRDVQAFSVTAEAEIRAVAVNNDHTFAAVGAADGKIRLWPLNKQSETPEVRILEGHAGEIRGLCFSADGSRLISASADKTVRVWNANDGSLAGRIDAAGEIHSVASVLLPGDSTVADAAPVEHIATAGTDKLIRIWKTPTRLPQPVAIETTKPAVLAVSQDGTLLATANGEGEVRIQDAKTGEVRFRWKAHPAAIHSLAFGQTPAPPAGTAPETAIPAERRFATAGSDGVVRVWSLGRLGTEVKAEARPEAKTAVPLAKPEDAEPAQLFALRGTLTPVRSVGFRKDGKQLVAGAEDGTLTVWSLESPAAPNQATRTLEPLIVAEALDPKSASRPLAVSSPDNKLLAVTATVNGHHAVLVRDIATGNLVQSLLGHAGPITSMAFSSDSRKIATGSDDKTARVWNLNSAKFAEIARFSKHEGPVTAVAFNSDSTQVLSGSFDNSVKLWSAETSELAIDFPGHAGPISGVGFLANNQPISASADKTVRVWNPANGKAARSQTETSATSAMCVARDGSRFAVAGADKSLKVYAAAGGAAQLTLAGHAAPVHSLAFSADSKRLVSGADPAAIVWDATDGRLLEMFPSAEKQLSCVAYGETASQVLLADRKQRVTLQAMQFVGAGRGMTKPVIAAAWHPNGQTVLAGCQDGTVRGFTVSNFVQAFSANHGAPVHAFAISEDGAKMASGGENKIVKLWNPANGAPLQPAQLALAGPVRGVDFTADGRRLVAGSIEGQRGQLVVFDVATPTGAAEHSVVGHAEGVIACLATFKGERGLSLSSDGIVLTWELLAAKNLTGHTQPVTSLAAVPPQMGQPLQLLSGSLDGTVRRWNLQTGQVLAQLNHGAPVTSVAARGDAQRWASASSNNTIRLWNAANNAQVAQMTGDLRAKTLVAKLTRQKTDVTAKVTAAKSALDTAEKAVPGKVTAEKTAATALGAATKDVEAKAAVLTVASTKKSNAERLAIEAAAKAQAPARKMADTDALAAKLTLVATELASKAARAKAAATSAVENQTLAKLTTDAMAQATAADSAAKAAVAAKAAPTAEATKASQAAAAAATAALALNKPFSDADNALRQSQNAQRAAKQTHEVSTRDLKFANDAVPAAKTGLAALETRLKKVDADLTAAIEAEKAAQKPVHAVAFSPDNRTLATGGDLGIVHTWDAETGTAVASFVGHEAPLAQIAFVDEKSVLSTAADKKAIVWNLNPSWRLERVIGDIGDPSKLIDRVTAVDFSNDGKLLATASGVPSRNGDVKIWNVADGALVHAIIDAHTDAATAVAFSPDDGFLASAAADKYVKTYSVATGKQVGQFEGHTNYVEGVSWRGGGKILASSGADGTIRIWNAETGDRIRVIQGFTKQVSAVRFIGETQFAVVATGQGLVRKYNTDNGGVQTNYPGTTEFMFAIDATADPNTGVVVSGGYDGQLHIWRANGPALQKIGPPPAPGDDALAEATEGE